MKHTKLFVFATIVALLCPALVGQTTSLRGQITDPQGAVVPGVDATITNVATGAVRQAVSDELGVYQFLQVSPGAYNLRAELPGFKAIERKNLQLPVNTPVTLDLRFELGELTDVIEVAAESTTNKVDATIGNNFTEVQIKNLPFEFRNVPDLLKLQPGVTETGEVNGGRRDQANITLDGVDVNDQQTGAAFSSVLPVTLDSVQEFRVTTSVANANQGRSSGAQVALITKSGSNVFHGSLYEYHRNTATTAYEYFAKRTELTKPESERRKPKLNRHVFGGSLGGPIVKDKFFFFINYEGRRESSQVNALRIVPTPNMKQGIIRYAKTGGGTGEMTSAQIKAVDPLGIGPNPAILALFRQYPDPNDYAQGPDGGLNFAGFRFNPGLAGGDNFYIARLDYTLDEAGKHMLSWRGNMADRKFDDVAPQFPGHQPARQFLDNSKGFVASYTTTISPTWTNDFRYGLTRQGIESSGASTLPSFGIRDYSTIFAFTRGSGRKIPVHNIVEDMSVIKGKHTLQFGTNFRFIRNDRYTAGLSYFNFSVNNGWMAGLGRNIGRPSDMTTAFFRTSYVRAIMGMLGVISQINGTYFFGRDGNALSPPHIPTRGFGANEYDFYLQDTWRMTSNFTFTLGLRYGYYGVPWETGGVQVNPTINVGPWFAERAANAKKGIPSNRSALIGFDLAGPANNKPSYYSPDKNNWAPRVAFAYSPSFDNSVLRAIFGAAGKASIRGGWGLFYDRIGGAMIVDMDLSGAVGLSTNVINQVGVSDYNNAPRFAGFDKFPGVPPAPKGGFPNIPASTSASTGFMIDNGLVTPYSMTMDFSIQRELGNGFTLETAYVGRLGRKLLAKADLGAPTNLIDPKSGMGWWEAVKALIPDIEKGTPTSQIQPLAYFENLFPSLKTSTRSATQSAYATISAWTPSWSDAQYSLDVVRRASIFGPQAMFQQQYNSLPVWTNWGSSSYHSLQLILRKRFSAGYSFDFNYTLSHSIDNGSAIENSGRLGGQIADAFNPRNFFSNSDFDVRHLVNANWVIELPWGRGKWLGSNWSGALQQIAGGWQATGLIRARSGRAFSVANGFNFPTNYFLTGPGTQIAPVTTTVNKGHAQGPNIFDNPSEALKAFKFTDPGSSGSRNKLRTSGLFTVDFGLFKSFDMPWEGHKVVFRWEVFNLSNTPVFGFPSINPEAPSTFGRFLSTIEAPRVMQFALRYEF